MKRNYKFWEPNWRKNRNFRRTWKPLNHVLNIISYENHFSARAALVSYKTPAELKALYHDYAASKPTILGKVVNVNLLGTLFLKNRFWKIVLIKNICWTFSEINFSPRLTAIQNGLKSMIVDFHTLKEMMKSSWCFQVSGSN